MYKPRMQFDDDYVLCECDLEPLINLVSELEQTNTVSIVKMPAVCLTMIRTEDSLEKQEFYLGEALTTECEVSINGTPGYGLCLGEEPQRSYSIAVIDSLLHQGAPAPVLRFLDRQREVIEERERREFNLTLRTQVDFKLMEEE
jgi:phosphonate C-P lyase system protein PhnG